MIPYDEFSFFFHLKSKWDKFYFLKRNSIVGVQTKKISSNARNDIMSCSVAIVLSSKVIILIIAQNVSIVVLYSFIF